MKDWIYYVSTSARVCVCVFVYVRRGVCVCVYGCVSIFAL